MTISASYDLESEDLGAASTDLRVACENGCIVGTVSVERRVFAGLLRSVSVASERRGTGLGRQLVGVAEALSVEQGLDALYLPTTTATPFFATLGYAQIERTEAPPEVRASSQFQGCCPASAVCTGKVLRPSSVLGTDERPRGL